MDSPQWQAVERPFNHLTRLIARESFLDEVARAHVSVRGLIFYIIYFITRIQVYKYRIRLLVKTACIRNYIIYYLPIPSVTILERLQWRPFSGVGQATFSLLGAKPEGKK